MPPSNWKRRGSIATKDIAILKLPRRDTINTIIIITIEAQTFWVKRTLKMEKFLFNKKYSGILWAIVIGVIFVLISLFMLNFLSGSKWYMFSSALRLVSGIAVLVVAGELYGIRPGDIFTFKGSRTALIAGAGFLVFFLYYIVGWSLGVKGIAGLSADILLTRILLQQLTTGFYEELNYRLLVCGGYFYSDKTAKNKLLFAFASFALFGVLHLIGGGGLFTFLQTGVIGFAFAVMYMKSGNILIPMLLHFIYDIFANLVPYMNWNEAVLARVNSGFGAALALMFVVSLIMLLRRDEINERL